MTFSFEKFLTPLALWMGLIHPPMAPPRDPPTFTILCYHTFNSATPSAYTVTSERFDEQMRYLAVQRIPVIRLSEAVDHLRLGKPIPDGSVVITIDDGYKSARTVAWPILHKYKFPFTLYVYPSAISKLRAYMTWDDIEYLEAHGADIESHTLTHPLLTHPPRAMNPAAYLAWLDNELRAPRAILEAHLHRPVRHLAYSYGGYDERVIERTRAAGYWSATTCDTANVTRHVKPLTMDRRLIFRQTTFKAYVEGFRARELLVTKRSPRDGEYVPDLPKVIQAQVLNQGQILPETLRIRVDHVRGGWHPVGYDPASSTVRFAMPAIPHRGYFFVSLRAQDKVDPSITRETTWLFITKKKKSM